NEVQPANNAVTGACASQSTTPSGIPQAAAVAAAPRRPASSAKWPRRAANHATRARLSQAPIEVASASPTCASDPIRATLQATLTATAISDALTGVAVSPRARNVAVTLRISTNGSRPMAYAARVRPAAVASAAVEAP